MDLDRASIDQNWLEGLDTKAVERGRAVKQNGALPDDVVEDVPHLRARSLYYSLGGLNVVSEPAGHQSVHNKRLKELKRHALGQATLVQLKLRTDDDDRAP